MPAKNNLSKTQIEEILSQAMEEYDFGLKYRHKREHDWQSVDDLYYGKKKKSLVTRAQVHIPKMQGSIETFVSKIDDPPKITYEAMEEGDKPKVSKLNALIEYDANKGDWDLIDLLSKKQGALYGRTIEKLYTTANNGFEVFHELVDVLDFVIDPLAGGLFPVKYARYMGQDNIIRSVTELKDKKYDQKAIKEIAHQLESDQAVDNKFSSLKKRREALNLSEAVMVKDDSVRLVEWYTHYKGEKVYCLFSPEHKISVRTVPLKKVIGIDEFPFSSWAVYPRMDEFWTPGVGELLKEANIIQDVIISQLLDNQAFRNYGMKIYDQNRIVNPAELTPRPMGKIAVDGNPKDIITDVTFPEITTAIQAFNLVEGIYAKESGLNAQAKGTPNSKRMSATEFAGLIDETADRFFTANKTYRNHLRRIGYLYQAGLEQNLTKERRIKVLGAKGVDWKKVTPEDVKGEFDVKITSGLEDEAKTNLERDRFIAYVVNARQNQRLNQAFLDEKEAQMAGLTDSEIHRLLDPEMDGDWEILAEAASENESLLKKDVTANRGATAGHVQKHLDYARTTDELSDVQRRRILAHADSELEAVMANEEDRARKKIQEMRAQGMQMPMETKMPLSQAAPAPLGGEMPGFTPEMGQFNPEAVRQEAIGGAPANNEGLLAQPPIV